MQAILVLLVVMLLARVLRQQRMVAGLAISTLGAVSLPLQSATLFFDRPSYLTGGLLAGLCFGVLYLGLRRILSGWPVGLHERSCGWRFSSVLAGFVVPWALTALALVLSHHLDLWLPFMMVVAPAIVAAGVASLVPSAAAASTQQPSWTQPALGVALTLVVILGQPLANAQLERARHSAREKLLATYPQMDPNLPYPRLFFQKGVNLTVEQEGGYASDQGREILESLPQYGINAVALVPYGFTRQRPSPTIVLGSLESDDVMRAGARIAHARGLKVMLKPSIWDAFSLQFSSADQRAQWFEEYRRFLEHYAKLAKQTHADVLCVGGELTHLTQYDAEWRKLIARAREIYPGPLVYAANFGDEFEHIQFWDALDYMGLQEYYPLPDDLSTASLVRKVEALQHKYQRPVIFTEVGFPSRPRANRDPWDDSQRSAVSLQLQASCYEAIFRAFYQKSWFEGLYWWKIGSAGEGGPADASLTPWGKPAIEVLSRWYLRSDR